MSTSEYLYPSCAVRITCLPNGLNAVKFDVAAWKYYGPTPTEERVELLKVLATAKQQITTAWGTMSHRMALPPDHPKYLAPSLRVE